MTWRYGGFIPGVVGVLRFGQIARLWQQHSPESYTGCWLWTKSSSSLDTTAVVRVHAHPPLDRFSKSWLLHRIEARRKGDLGEMPPIIGW